MFLDGLIVTKPVVVSSFKNTIVAAGLFPRLLPRGEHGEIAHGLPAITTAATRLRGYGRIEAISREALLNDDIGLIGGVIESLAYAAASCESDIAYSALLDNPTMGDGFALFSTQHKNLAPAAGLTTASLADARALLTAQTPPSGGETAAVPQLVVDARIADARWYLATDPSTWPTVAVAHLTDQATPLVDTRDGWDIEGREVRARLDVAADFRGLVLTPAV
jgi:hypothetical protein